jgi:cytochrome c biogenesis protein ResB
MDYQKNYQGFWPCPPFAGETGQQSARSGCCRLALTSTARRSILFHLRGLSQDLNTGLHVAKDTGVNIWWVGCTLMIIGIIIAFFMSHQRLWIRLAPSADGRVEVVLAGSASKNRLAFEKKFEKMREELKAVGV